MKKVALIMAGGKGERFWPASRNTKPKQLLSIVSEETMISQTVSRLEGLIEKEDIFIVTGESYKKSILEQVEGLKEENIICEPVGRDTANAIALAGIYIEKKYDDAAVCVLSADHAIKPVEEFRNNLIFAFSIAEENDCIITIGIVPTRPDTGYGYIQKDGLYKKNDNTSAFKVFEFKEKPDKETAFEYFKSGNYLWNSGMFIWKNSFFMHEYKKHLNENYAKLEYLKENIGTPKENEILKDIFPTLFKISVDYGVLEKSKNIYCIESTFQWDDVGSWSSLYRHIDTDKNGNAIKGNAALLDSSGCLTYADDDTIIGIVDLEDIMVIKSGNAVLVCRKKDDQKVKKLLEIVKENSNSGKYL
jgi:mannose-1-phosphate guanylyltransferase